MKKLLSNIASVQSGIYTKPTLSGTVKYLQVRHFDKNYQFDDTVKSNIALPDGKIERHLLKGGDILLAVKGYDHFAVMYNESIGSAVASTVFLVIRLKSKEVLREYLVWFLNHPRTQGFLAGSSKGSNLPSITKSDVENIEVPIPSVEIQKTVLEIYKLRQQEIDIKQRIEELHELSVQHQILNAINQP